VLARATHKQTQAWSVNTALVCGVAVAFAYAGALDPHRYADMVPTLLQLVRDAWPPDFRRFQHWTKPVLETLAMSVAGTALSVVAALPLAALSARNVTRARWLGAPALLLLNVLRSIPELVWGVLFVAAVGFGPLPGVLALACHSTGMLGKFFSETFEHAATAPGDALRSHGVSSLGVLRYSLLAQALPQMVDVALYRLEHNVRAATTVGMVGAGGLGLEIISAFQLFEYREAAALLTLLLALVSVIGVLGARIRAHFRGIT
jgi:phosphonate transport system permease protein